MRYRRYSRFRRTSRRGLSRYRRRGVRALRIGYRM